MYMEYILFWGYFGRNTAGKAVQPLLMLSGFLIFLHRYPYEKSSQSPGNTESLNPQEAQSQRHPGEEV